MDKISELEKRLNELEEKSVSHRSIWNYMAAILIVNVITMCILIFQK